jgi:hypothetical protein
VNSLKEENAALLFDEQKNNGGSVIPFAYKFPKKYPVHWIWGHQITQIQIKSEKFEDFDWISEFGKRQ